MLSLFQSSLSVNIDGHIQGKEIRQCNILYECTAGEYIQEVNMILYTENIKVLQALLLFIIFSQKPSEFVPYI